MKGTFIGDVVGSVYEFHNIKNEDFEPLFGGNAFFTDDTVLTAATGTVLSLTEERGLTKDEEIVALFAETYRKYTLAFPGRGYGGHFLSWAHTPDAKPYNSCGNGSAMRVSPVAWYAKTMEECERFAKLSALPTHNHPDGIAGAQATAGAIFLALHGGSKEEIKAYVERYYPLPKTYAEVQPDYGWVSVCDGTVQPAVLAFLASESFEDAIRKAIALGGDSDTIAAITGPIAEAYYGVPDEIWRKALRYFADREGAPILACMNRSYELHEKRCGNA